MNRRITRLAVAAAIAVLVAACAPTQYYGVYQIRSLPPGAQIVGPGDSDWGRDAEPNGVQHWFKSAAPGCKKYAIKLVLPDYADTTTEVEGCTNSTSKEAAISAMADDPSTFKRVYRMEQLGGHWDVTVTSDPPGASVYVGAQFHGTTAKEKPLTVTLPWTQQEKQHALRFELPGFKSVTVPVIYPEKSASAVLQPVNAGER